MPAVTRAVRRGPGRAIGGAAPTISITGTACGSRLARLDSTGPPGCAVLNCVRAARGLTACFVMRSDELQGALKERTLKRDAQATTEPCSSRRPEALRLPPPPACVETALPRLRRPLEPARAAGARARRAARRTRPAEDDRASRLGPARGRGALSPRPPRPLPSSLLRLEADQPGAASRARADMGGRKGAADPRPITTSVIPLRLRRRPRPDA